MEYLQITQAKFTKKGSRQSAVGSGRITKREQEKFEYSVKAVEKLLNILQSEAYKRALGDV
ncbi:MAG: hypothetical protein VKN72_14360 [Nostocales cyanobacterium 94392]|nr:hypothetical protein [Nostocales cyanobacterium 94392]